MWRRLSLSSPVEVSQEAEDLVQLELLDFWLSDHKQPSTLRFLNHARNGALVQSIFTAPPLVAQLSAFHRLPHILIGCLIGNGALFSFLFFNSLIGIPSTYSLSQLFNVNTLHFIVLWTEYIFFCYEV